MKVADKMVAAAEAELSDVLADDFYLLPPDGMHRVLTAALAEQTQQGVEVKALPLNWTTEKKSGFTIHIGRGLGLKYEACIKAYSPGWVVTLGQSDVVFDGAEADEDDAKAAAQSDYETRIRSALVDVPAVESEPVALIEREVLAELAKHKTATGTVCSPLFKSKFGDKVPLYAHPPRSLSNEGWRPIETAPKDKTSVIIAVPTKDRDGWIVGEASFDPEHYEGGDWWWANLDYSDYHAGPISDCNHHAPEFWQPLPTPPLSTRKGSAGDGAATGTSGGAE